MANPKAIDSVWCEEGGYHAFFTRLDNGRVVVRLVEHFAAVNEKDVAQFTLTGWRWERIVKAMQAGQSCEAKDV